MSPYSYEYRYFDAQFPVRTTTSIRRFYEQKTKLMLELRSMRRLLHNEFEAVVGLYRNMAGLRFFVCLHLKFPCPIDDRTRKEKRD